MQPAGDNTAFLIPLELLAELEAAAHDEHREPGEVVREALERYLSERRRRLNRAGHSAAKVTPAEAVARLLEQRADNVLPEGVTIRELMTYGRA